jgi:NAD(P)H-dependent FMN reductase
MNVIVFSCSLNPQSRSRVLAERAVAALAEDGHAATLMDLRRYPLPLCDGCDTGHDANAQRLAGMIRDADAVLLAVPVYNYDANAAAKNLIELTGRAWTDKVVGFLCAAGGRGSYMSVMSLANSLMLDFRCLIVPRFVYAIDRDFDGTSGGGSGGTSGGGADSGGVAAAIDARIAELCRKTTLLAAAVRAPAAT